MNMRLRLFILLKSVAGAISLKTFLGLFLTATYVVQAWAVAEFLNAIFLGRQLDSLWWMMMLIGGMILLRAGLIWLNEILGKKIACNVKERLRKQIFTHFFPWDPAIRNSAEAGTFNLFLPTGWRQLSLFWSVMYRSF